MGIASSEPYDPQRVSPVGEHAVVLGASVAGLLAARVLADAFERVTILDRDPLDAQLQLQPRRGVPQGQHIHVLMVAGQAVMEELAPGLADDLVAAGANVLDVSREITVHAAGDFIAEGSADLPMYYASRPLIEGLLRARITDYEHIALRPDYQVIDHLADPTGTAVTGVVARSDGEEHRIAAELVVDATGRTSRSTAWREQLGYTSPASESVEVDLAYRSCQLARPPDDRRAILIMPSPPRARGAAVAPIEDDRWLVTVFGMHGDHPPDHLDGLREFAGTLPTPVVADLLEQHEPVTDDVARYRFPASTRRRYDQLEAHPRGLLAVGDAVASFNPIYGQGMSVAALEALALHHTLAEHDDTDLASAFYARTGSIVDDAWNISVGGDFQFAETRGPKPSGTAVVNRYLSRLHRRAHTDAELADAFSRVVVMEQPPRTLFHPRVAWRVLRPSVTAR